MAGVQDGDGELDEHEREHPEVSFGGFSNDGLDDPLAPHVEPGYVEEIDDDPAPMLDLVEHDADRLPWFGATPWSGPRDQPDRTRRTSRAVATVAAVSVVVGAAALVIWRLLG